MLMMEHGLFGHNLKKSVAGGFCTFGWFEQQQCD
jgi:hypothetical protein